MFILLELWTKVRWNFCSGDLIYMKIQKVELQPLVAESLGRFSSDLCGVCHLYGYTTELPH